MKEKYEYPISNTERPIMKERLKFRTQRTRQSASLHNFTGGPRSVVAEYFDYISLTDIACYKDSYETNDLIRNWLQNRNTLAIGHSFFSLDKGRML
jgi:hypothetical protein